MVQVLQDKQLDGVSTGLHDGASPQLLVAQTGRNRRCRRRAGDQPIMEICKAFLKLISTPADIGFDIDVGRRIRVNVHRW